MNFKEIQNDAEEIKKSVINYLQLRKGKINQKDLEITQEYLMEAIQKSEKIGDFKTAYTLYHAIKADNNALIPNPTYLERSKTTLLNLTSDIKPFKTKKNPEIKKGKIDRKSIEENLNQIYIQN